MATLIQGKPIADAIKAEMRAEIEQLRQKSGQVPSLAVVLVGNRVDSHTYVRMKKKSAEEIGIRFTLSEHTESVTEQQLIDVIEGFNQDKHTHGIIVQLPLPSHINEKNVLERVAIEKDVDGFNSVHIGNLALKGRIPLFVSCTPKGCLELLDRSHISLSGKHVVVIGRSNIVGIPMSLLLLHRDATVTICHSRTKNLPEVVKTGDIVVAAVGKAEFVKGDWIKPGAVVIDVGINTVPDQSKPGGQKLVGDVDFQQVKQVASAITPVPGGVGPLTVSMLLSNTLSAFKHLNQLTP